MAKRALAALLALLMVLGLLAGCAAKEDKPASEETVKEETKEPESKSEETQKESDEPKVYSPDEYYTIQIAAGTLDGSTSTLESKVGQYIADRFGIVFEYVPVSGDYWEFLTLQLAGGTYGEMVWLEQEPGFRPYADAGVLLNLEDYKDILPDFFKYYEEQIPYWKARTENGGIYGWDYTRPNRAPKVSFWDVAVRSDVLEYYGYPDLLTASDYIAFLEKAVKDFPTALDGSSTTGMNATFGESYGIAGFTHGGTEKGDKWIPSNACYAFDLENACYVDQYVDVPESKESVKFWNDLYQKGLLDLESFTDTDDQQTAKMSVGQPIMIYYTAWNNTAANEALTAAGHPEMSYVSLPFQLDSQVGQSRLKSSSGVVEYDATFALTNKCKDPERLLSFINWCCTPEGQTILMSGFEGETYTVNEEGLREPTELRYEIAMSQDLAREWGIPQRDLQSYPGLPQGRTIDENGVPYNFAWDQAFMDQFGLTDREKEVYFQGLGWTSSNAWWQDHFDYYDVDTGEIAIPGDTDLGKEATAMTECYIRNAAKIIMADDFEAAWDSFINEYTQYDWEGVKNEYNRLYQEYLIRFEE